MLYNCVCGIDLSIYFLFGANLDSKWEHIYSTKESLAFRKSIAKCRKNVY